MLRQCPSDQIAMPASAIPAVPFSPSSPARECLVHEPPGNPRLPWLPHALGLDAALADQETLLIDHKNNEFKAAATAMALMASTACTWT